VGLAATLSGGAGLALSGVITGWNLTAIVILGLLLWPGVARAMTRPAAVSEERWEWAGLDVPLTVDQLRTVEERLGIDSDVRVTT
jgi:hypothetical protein